MPIQIRISRGFSHSQFALQLGCYCSATKSIAQLRRRNSCRASRNRHVGTCPGGWVALRSWQTWVLGMDRASCTMRCGVSSSWLTVVVVDSVTDRLFGLSRLSGDGILKILTPMHTPSMIPLHHHHHFNLIICLSASAAAPVGRHWHPSLPAAFTELIRDEG